jgi:integrin beta 3
MNQLPDALAEVLGKIIAETKADGRREIERIASEARAIVAELKAEVVELKAQLRERMASVKDGEPGAPGLPGDAGPAGRDGVDGKDGSAGSDGRDGADGRDGRDGVGMAGAYIDRGGHLVVTMSDGTIRELGAVVGRDGAPGDAGRDGRDGLGFDDLEVAFDGERTMTLSFRQGRRERVFPVKLPILVDRGVFKSGTAYERGDAVTYGGSLWIAQRDAGSCRPGEGDAWRLSVKRGRDGKPGERGPQGPKGDPGEAE